MEIITTKNSAETIAKYANENVEGNVIILSKNIECTLGALFLYLTNNSIAYKRIFNGIEYSHGNNKTIQVFKISYSTWGVHVDDDIECLCIENADLIHEKILERLIINQKCKIVLTCKTKTNGVFVQQEQYALHQPKSKGNA